MYAFIMTYFKGILKSESLQTVSREWTSLMCQSAQIKRTVFVEV